ncbi:hypothetical protein BpHYR1_048464, partial [Brachionus plicatilis]
MRWNTFDQISIHLKYCKPIPVAKDVLAGNK